MNIAEILKKCPEGTELYSPIFGEVKFSEIQPDDMIVVIIKNNSRRVFFKDGSYSEYGECVLFPSKKQLDWSKFGEIDQEAKYQFKPFDKVLVRNYDTDEWLPGFFYKFDLGWNNPYHIMNLHHLTDYAYRECIPYEGNEHLLGTSNKPE